MNTLKSITSTDITIESINFKNVKFAVLFFAFLIVFFYVVYKFSYSSRTKTKIFEFELAYSKYLNKNQLDYCQSDKYSNTIVADYFICSSYNPISTGFLKYDYVSLGMIEKTIMNGCRYIELEILDKDIKHDTIPVIAVGELDKRQITSQNYLECNEVLDMINTVAFSQKYINNFNDPLFIFLNIKTKNNSTLDKLYDCIITNLNHRLLSDTYSHQKVNIATTKLCNLIQKVVIFASEGHEHSKLDELVNMSTNSSFLNRLKWDELPHKEDLLDHDDPIVSLMSSSIGFTNNTIYISGNTNFVDLGISPENVLSIHGAKNSKNNTNESLLHIKQVTNDKIILDETVVFDDEKAGSDISIKVFSVSHLLTNLDKQNRSSLTIVYTHRDFFTFNYDPNTAWRLGCQFACMNFQRIDDNLNKYMKKFKSSSLVLKPTNLRNVVRKPIVKSLKNQLPEIINSNIPLLTNFIANYENTEVKILPFSNKFDRIGCCYNMNPNSTFDCSQFLNQNQCSSVSSENDEDIDENVCRFTQDLSKCHLNLVYIINKKNNPTLSIENTNNLFVIEKGLDTKFGSISIRSGNRYLITNDTCCYLSFKKKPKDTENKLDNFNKHASFFPVSPKCDNETFVSFLQVYDSKNYYIKYRQEFDSNEKIYKKITTDYIKILSFQDYHILRPKTSNNYKTIGDIIVNKSMIPEISNIFDFEKDDTTSTKSSNLAEIQDVIVESFQDKLKSESNFLIIEQRPSLLLKGAIADPLDYEKVWSEGGIYIWKPVAPDGYVSLGVVFSIVDKKPVDSNICCLSSQYIKETDYNTDPVFLYDDTNNVLSLWASDTSNTSYQYLSVSLNNSAPSKFIHPVYDFDFDEKDHLDKLYMGDVKSNELESACFRVDKEQIKPDEYNNSIDLNTQNSNYKLKNNKGQCLGLKKSYWSSIFDDKQLQEETPSLILGECGNNDHQPTNFVFHKENNTIRLRDKSDYCFEIFDEDLELKKCNNSETQQFIYKDNHIISMQNKKCLDYSNSDIKFSLCDNSRSQNWSMGDPVHVKCLKENDIVFFKTKIGRSDYIQNSDKENKTEKYNYLEEPIDSKNFHLYLKSKIKGTNEEDNDYWDIELFNDLGYEKVHKNSNSLVFYDNDMTEFKKGDKILMKNGGLDIEHYDERVVRWEATVIDVYDETLEILFTINSIEADLNKFSLGRPRVNEKLFVKKSNVLFLQPSVSC